MALLAGVVGQHSPSPAPPFPLREFSCFMMPYYSALPLRNGPGDYKFHGDRKRERKWLQMITERGWRFVWLLLSVSATLIEAPTENGNRPASSYFTEAPGEEHITQEGLSICMDQRRQIGRCTGWAWGTGGLILKGRWPSPPSANCCMHREDIKEYQNSRYLEHPKKTL